MIDHLNGRDIMTLFVEGEKGIDKAKVESELKYLFKARIGIATVSYTHLDVYKRQAMEGPIPWLFSI